MSVLIGIATLAFIAWVIVVIAVLRMMALNHYGSTLDEAIDDGWRDLNAPTDPVIDVRLTDDEGPGK